MAADVIFEPRFPPVLSKAESIPTTRLHTKIVCTLTPFISSVDSLISLIDSGMSFVRLNLAFSDLRFHYQALLNVKEANRLRPDRPCGVIADLKGSMLRIGKFRGLHRVTLTPNQDFTIVPDSQVEGDTTSVSCTYEHLGKAVKSGMPVYLDHGKIACEVQSVDEAGIHMIVKRGGELGGGRSIQIPGAQFKLPVISDKDEDDLLNFVLKNNIDYVSVSGAKQTKDIERVRQILGDKGAHLKVLVKLQTSDSLTNFEGILDACDGVVVARRDLSLEIPADKVFLAQKAVASRCALYGKIVILSTEIMEGTTETEALEEAAGVVNSIRDGVDALQMADETSGVNPEAAIRKLAELIAEGEELFAYEGMEKRVPTAPQLNIDSVDAVCRIAVLTAIRINARIIIVITESGYAALQLAKYRLHFPILCMSTISATLTQLSLVRSCIPQKLEETTSLEVSISSSVNHAKEHGFVSRYDQVVLVACENEMESKTGVMKVILID